MNGFPGLGENPRLGANGIGQDWRVNELPASTRPHGSMRVAQTASIHQCGGKAHPTPFSGVLWRPVSVFYDASGPSPGMGA